MVWPFTKSADTRKPSDDPNGKIVQRFSRWRRPVVTYQEKLAAEQAMRHIITYRCLDKIATTFQGIGWYIERDPNVPKSFRTSDTNVEKLEQVFRNPSDDMTARQMRYWMALVWAGYGRIPIKAGVFTGMPNGLYALNPALCAIKRNGAGVRHELRYGPDGDSVNIPYFDVMPKGTTGLPTEAYSFVISKPSMQGLPDNESNTPLNSVGLPTNIVSELLQRAWDTASGHPNTKYIVSTEKTLTDPQRDKMKDKFESARVGEEESGNVLILSNTKVNVTQLDNSLADIHSKLPLDDMTRQIAGAFGIPVALIGQAGADGSKFANNYEESRKSFFEDTIIPGYCEPICDGMSKYACPEGYVLRYDPDTIPALMEMRAKRAKDVSLVNFLTLDEKRELCGFGPMPAGEEPHNPSAPKTTTTEPPKDATGA